MSVDPVLVQIDLTRDNLFDNFTIQTIKERYLLPGETSPQHAFARAAAAFADDPAHAQRLYEYVSNLWFMFATPLLSNGGSERGLPISCFLSVAADSREGIFAHWTETGWLSSVGGGVGGYWGDLRSSGERTGRGSASTGVIPFIATVDRLMLSVSQGGTRRGSYAAYLDISHPEIEEFIVMRKPTGGDQNRKTLNLHNAVNVTDEFMTAVTDDLDFHLRSPKDNSIRKTVRARELWKLLIETRMQTGEPYMVFIDSINRALPEAQKKLGLKVKQSNLCVSPETYLLTRKGNIPISILKDQEVEAWNGVAYSKVTVRKTSESSQLIRVTFEDGGHLDCTPEHIFYLQDGTTVPTIMLKKGDKLEKGIGSGPVIEGNDVFHDKQDIARGLAFTAGWATFAGVEDQNRLSIQVPNTATVATLTKLLATSVDSHLDEAGTLVRYEPETISSGFVPFHWDILSRREWFAGAFEAAGEIVENGPLKGYYAIGSDSEELIQDMRLMALETGLRPVIRVSTTTSVFMLSPAEYRMLQKDSRTEEPDQAIVVSCTPLPFERATYCATEPVLGRLTFNGYVTGNCTEITLPTGIDQDGKMRTAVCCLSSVNAEKFDEWRDDPYFLEDLFRMLDNALTVFIEQAPASLENAVYSAKRERSVGLGLLGFQAYLQSRGFSMESQEARNANVAMFSHLRSNADLISQKLGAERGEAPDMAGTGERFAHKLAIAPNASSSILCGGTSPSIEPHRANTYLHKTLSGSFPVKNKFLIEALRKLDLDTEETWKSIIANEGSIQHLDLPLEIKEIFKTAIEIDQMVIVKLAADRAKFICQAQSVNLFFDTNETNWSKLSKPHYMAWAMGVKSLYYLRATTPKRAENTNTKVERILMTDAPKPIEDSECVACEG